MVANLNINIFALHELLNLGAPLLWEPFQP